MYGVPKVLATRADFERVHHMALSGECAPEQALAQWRGLLDGRLAYEHDRVLADGEAPDGAEPEYRVLEEEREDGSVERVQYRLVDQPHARIYRLGFSIAEVEARITDLEAFA